MCGLVGVSKKNLLAADRDRFDLLLFIDQIRGKDATGVMAVNSKYQSQVYKRALCASDFMQLKGYSSVRYFSDKILMGHNRSATIGDKVDDNAHPFNHGYVTLSHNGTLTNKWLVNKGQESFSTDSETIAYALDEEDEVVPVLERLEGAYALVWWDSFKRTLNFARNKERELYLGEIDDGLYWASEKPMLELVGSRDRTHNVKNIQILPVGEWLEFHVETGKCDITPFTPKETKPYTPPVTQSVGGYYGNHRGGLQEERLGKPIHRIATGGSEKVKGYIIEVNPTGTLEAMDEKGEVIKAYVGHDKREYWLQMMADDMGIQGIVTSVVHEKGVKTTWLHAQTLESCVMETGGNAQLEKKCGICHKAIKNGEIGEVHCGDLFHSSCLDVSLEA